MSLRDALKKAAGLVIEFPEEEAESETPPASSAPASTSTDTMWADLEREVKSKSAPTKTVEQIVREAPGPNLDQIQLPPNATLPTPTPEGTLDFQSVYQQAGVPPAPFSAEQTLEMIAGLPQELPLDTKRQTLRVTLGALGKTIGATPETVVADASRKLAALAAYSESVAQQTTAMTQQNEAEISSLLARAEQLRQASLAIQQRQAQVIQMCAAETDRLDDLLEFFSLDTPPSKYAPPAPPKAE